MPSHWTYEASNPEGDLFQGDIIKRTEPLLKMLGSVHSYFCDEKYLGFIVASQTCDLVMRGGSCKAKYINLAVIRSLESMVPSFLEDICGTPIPGVYYEDGRAEVKGLLERIINQNEQALGLFYLEPDGDLKIAVESIALLRVSIALRAQHYEIIKASRIGRLRSPFRNKLGWLTGNLYSRVDTPDWPEAIGKSASDKKVDSIFKDIDQAAKNQWVPKPLFELTLRKKPEIVDLPKEAVLLVLQAHAPKPPHEIALDRMKEVAMTLLDGLTPADFIGAAEQLKSNRAYLNLSAVAAFQEIRGAVNAAKSLAFFERLAADGRMQEIASAWLTRLSADFMKAKVKKDFPAFLSMYSDRNVFEADAEALLAEIASDGGLTPEEFDAIRTPILGLKPTPAMMDCIVAIIRSASAPNLASRMASRLGNDGAFRGAFAAQG